MHIFSEEPLLKIATSPCFSRYVAKNDSVSSFMCEREPTAVNGRSFFTGNETASFKCACVNVSFASKLIFNAPCPLMPKYNSPVTGTYTTPNKGRPSFTSATFTVNSPLRLMNSLVPSNGSTIHKVDHCFLSLYSKCFPSSLSTG